MVQSWPSAVYCSFSSSSLQRSYWPSFQSTSSGTSQRVREWKCSAHVRTSYCSDQYSNPHTFQMTPTDPSGKRATIEFNGECDWSSATLVSLSRAVSFLNQPSALGRSRGFAVRCFRLKWAPVFRRIHSTFSPAAVQRKVRDAADEACKC